MKSLHAVLFPVITGALTMAAVEAGFDPVLLVITSPLIIAYPFLWAWDYVHQGAS